MEGYCPFNQKMSMMKMSTCWKWHSDENLINDEKGRWWVKGKKKEKQNQQETRKERRKKKKKKRKKDERKNPFRTAARQWPTKGGRRTVLCCFWCPIKKHVYKLFYVHHNLALYLAIQLQISSCVFMNISVQTSTKESSLSRYTLIWYFQGF